jgi:hydroxyethylthiazole kinase-like uncharacterized protein yjeF
MPTPDQILTVAQMRAAEDTLIEAGSSVSALMAVAGQGAAEWIWRIAGRQRVTVLCGPGNNGGDGYVIAQTLFDRGSDVRVVAAGEPRTQAAIAARQSFTGEVLVDAAGASGEVFVDCLFGSGLSRVLSDDRAALLSTLARAHRVCVAIDVPSGVDADSGAILSSRLPNYDLTIALGAWKFAHFLAPAAAGMGALRLLDIGICAQAGAARLLVRPSLTAPPADAHKYLRGLVMVVGGEMPGAAAMAAESCARAGAGYVRLSAAQPASASHAIVQMREPDFTKAKAVLIGPGLGRQDHSRGILGQAMNAGVPTVADADALWWFGKLGLDALPTPAIMTPHEGEFVGLFGKLAGSKIDRARAAAKRSGAVIVYKGPDTVIAAPDGRVVVCPPAPTWLSTAGTGDVLAGICASRLATADDAFEAACEAVWLHGEAARLAGPSFAADDLIRHIPEAIATCL